MAATGDSSKSGPRTKDSPSASQKYTYPFSASPDIIRSNQKDVYFQGVLLEQFSTIVRRLCGTRFVHARSSEIHTTTDFLYLSLTTLIGNRTLGEEYTDIHQIETPSYRFPSVSKRAGYILGAVLLPYSLSKILPSFRTLIRQRLERNLSRIPETSSHSLSRRIQHYILENLSTITSINSSPILAISLALFYFNGAYYHLSKRIFSLRYIFPKHLSAGEQRVGYEVLGVLLVLQMTVQMLLHVKSTIDTSLPTEGASAILDDGVEIGLPQQSNQIGIAPSAQELASPTTSLSRISLATHTPLPPSSQPRYDLSNASTLAWLQPRQQRKCTLCLEPMKDPSVTTCGHVFCWTCILDWVGEKAECPLCRQAVLGQHVLPLRG